MARLRDGKVGVSSSRSSQPTEEIHRDRYRLVRFDRALFSHPLQRSSQEIWPTTSQRRCLAQHSHTLSASPLSLQHHLQLQRTHRLQPPGPRPRSVSSRIHALGRVVIVISRALTMCSSTSAKRTRTNGRLHAGSAIRRSLVRSLSTAT